LVAVNVHQKRKDNNSIFEKCVQAKIKDVLIVLGQSTTKRLESPNKKTIKMQRS